MARTRHLEMDLVDKRRLLEDTVINIIRFRGNDISVQCFKKVEGEHRSAQMTIGLQKLHTKPNVTGHASRMRIEIKPA